MNRRDFLKNAALFCCALPMLAANASGNGNFKAHLRKEIKAVIKKHAYEPDNESTHRVIEAELNDWAHIHVMSGEIAGFHVECFDEDECLHVQAGFKTSEDSGWIIIESKVKS